LLRGAGQVVDALKDADAPALEAPVKRGRVEIWTGRSEVGGGARGGGGRGRRRADWDRVRERQGEAGDMFGGRGFRKGV
jgi:hypothetical protein